MCSTSPSIRHFYLSTVVGSALSTKSYDRRSLEAANQPYGHELNFFEDRLTPATAPLAAGFTGVSVFVNDEVSRKTIEQLAASGTRIVATRSAGFNHIDLAAAAGHPYVSG